MSTSALQRSLLAAGLCGLTAAGCSGEPEDTESPVEAQTSALTAQAEAWAVLYANQPSNPSYVPDTAFQMNSKLVSASVTHVSGGDGYYQVTLPAGLDFNVGGNVQVVAVGKDAAHCVVNSWSQDGSTGQVVIFVQCYDATDTAVESGFTLSYQHRTAAPPAPYVAAYLWNDHLADSGTVDPTYSYNSKGGANSVAHTGTGRYTVTLPKLAISATTPAGIRGSVMVTQYFGNGTCKVESWGNSGSDTQVKVRCFDYRGVAQDNFFTLAFGNLSPLGTPSSAYAYANNSTSSLYVPPASTTGVQHHGSVNIVPAGSFNSKAFRDPKFDDTEGRYFLYFPSAPQCLVSRYRYDTFVTAVGTDSKFCKAFFATNVHDGDCGETTDPAVSINCFTAAGAHTDSKYVVNYAGERSSP